MMILAVYFFLFYCTVAFLLNLHYFRWKARLIRPPDQTYCQKISVLVPVRNEERNIKRCLDSLLDQSYPNLEIIAMDDHSEDSSWEILQGYAAASGGRVQACRSQALPDGWSGKNWVCHQLSLRASGSWLAFTDADTAHGRDSILRAFEESRVRGADMVSYLPDIRTVSLAEKIIIPVIYLAFYLFFPLGLLSRFSNGNAAVAIGTFILVRSDVYRQVGGHLALQEEIVEDMHLARLVKAEGKKVEFLDGTGLFFTRFYDSAKAIWEGFSKNTFGAFGYSVVPFLLTLAACYGIFLNPFVQLAINPALGFSNPYFNQALLIILLRLALALRTRHSLLSVVFHPVMVCFALAFALNSIWKIMRRIPVVWKGREYRIMK